MWTFARGEQLFLRFSDAVAPAVLLFLALSAAAQQEDLPGRLRTAAVPPEPAMRAAATGTIVVRLDLPNGTALPAQAEVRLYSHTGFQESSAWAKNDPQVTFTQVPVGEYSVEVIAQGFAPVREQAVLWEPGMTTVVHLRMRPATTDPVMPGPAGLPLLAPKARKQTENGLKALRSNNLSGAREQFERALKVAPGHPYVNFLVGLAYLRSERPQEARKYLEKCTALGPDFGPGYEALGAALNALGDSAGAISAWQKAIVLSPDRWELHWRIGVTYFHTQQFESARLHVERAKDLSKGEFPEAQMLLGLSLARLRQREPAIRELEDFVNRFSDHPQAPRARQALESLRGETDATLHFALANLGVASEESTRALLEVESAGRHWAPPEVDEVVPPVRPGVACQLPEILRAAGQRVLALAQNLESIGATERIDHAELDAFGYEQSSGSAKFQYIVTIRETRPGTLSVEEDREGPRASSRARMFATGLAAMAVAFHPYYVDDFEMRCEGLGQWRGQPAWQIHFQQRNDRPSRILVYRSGGRVVPIAQKGRAWIAADTQQIVRLETDLLGPMPEIGLLRQHLAIEYGPVNFRKKGIQLWLPATAVLHAQKKGRRIRHQHVFTDFILFSVDTRVKIQEPAQPPQ